ncbi:MAG: tyrosine-type recombinase/integrase [Gammaproteobacteria bacterium]|nr:tyrosine-type recombinase/integrase [Gammaproteobacteria bacterium]
MYKKYRVYYYVARVDGKNKWIRLSSDYQESLYKYAELEGNQQNTGLVKDTIDRYSAEILPSQSKKTIETRRYQLKKLKAVFGDMKLESVEPPYIQQYLDGREAKVSANREIKLLSTIYRHAITWGLCKSNPCQGAFYHKEKSRDRYITDDELLIIHKNADVMFQSIIDLAYLTGMRRGDILGLKLVDIDDDKGIYNQQNKTGKKQLFTWTPTLRIVIANAKRARKTRNLIYLFTNSHGQKITDTGFNSAWRRVRERAGLTDITFHDIRAKSLTDAKEIGGLEYAQALGGHSRQGMTEQYIKKRETEVVNPLK